MTAGLISRTRRHRALGIATLGVLLFLAWDGGHAQQALVPTPHPPLPGHPSLYWLVPDPTVPSRPAGAGVAAGDDAALERLAQGVTRIAAGDYAAGLPLLDPAALTRSPLLAYAHFYRGVAMAGLERPRDARAAFTAALTARPDGYLAEALPFRLAVTARQLGEPAEAVVLLTSLLRREPAPADADAIWLELAGAAEDAGDRARATAAYRHLYDERPLTDEAEMAGDALARLDALTSSGPEGVARLRVRAERLLAGRRWAEAREAFATLAPRVGGDDAYLVALHLARCELNLRRYREARDRLAPLLDHARLGPEARFYHLSAVRGLGQGDAFTRLVRALVAAHPESDWSAEALNLLATHEIVADRDAAADVAFRDLLARFPAHRYAERAAWKVGWTAYGGGRFAEAATIFERGAARFPRSDYRPSWLYWAGRAHERLNAGAAAEARYRLVVADYQHSYYGRLAESHLRRRGVRADVRQVAAAPVTASAAPIVPGDVVIRRLIGLALYDDALHELDYARRSGADGPALQATIAWVRHQQGLTLTATARFERLRGAITQMRRAYPQFMAAGGEQLPPDVLRVIFPLTHWTLIEKYAGQHDLDPFLMAALIAQESTFTPEITSSAQAVGLMQLMPATGRRFAARAGVQPFRVAQLFEAEPNVRIGMQYFAELMERFGKAHLALASYNAGENRVVRWLAERPDMPDDQFIDDIPFPETQNYVKRILGTAEDYRRLYGGQVLDPLTMAPVRQAAARPAAGVQRASAPAGPSRPTSTSTSASRPAPRPAAGPLPGAPPSSAARLPAPRP
ncbi:MAG: transglycosylase SLT domain-containing protein [Vicinamibacterales bacterium]